MTRYLLKRILFFLPTLIIISVLTFYLSSNAPGDPIEAMLSKNGHVNREEYNALKKRLGLDLPLFYFSLTDATQPDTLYRVNDRTLRYLLERLYFEIGNKQAVAIYYSKVERLMEEAKHLNLDVSREALLNNNLGEIERELNQISASKKLLIVLCDDARTALKGMKANINQLRRYIPVLHFYGLNNQYHNWMKNILKGDFGISYQDKRPVLSVIKEAIGITLLISFISVFIGLLIAIPMGAYSAWFKGTTFDKIVSGFLFGLFAFPNFWMSTLLIIFFAGGDYFAWFPSHGLGNVDEFSSSSEKIGSMAKHLVLPVICLMYGSLAIIARQLRGQMIQTLNSDYIKSAKAKGVSNHGLIWKHALRNSLIPVITVTAALIPVAISGSFVVEYIFSIPGMGKLSYEALMARNYPLVYTVVLLTAFISVLSNLVADVLYAWTDPKIRYN